MAFYDDKILKIELCSNHSYIVGYPELSHTLFSFINFVFQFNLIYQTKFFNEENSFGLQVRNEHLYILENCSCRVFSYS